MVHIPHHPSIFEGRLTRQGHGIVAARAHATALQVGPERIPSRMTHAENAHGTSRLVFEDLLTEALPIAAIDFLPSTQAP